LQAAFADIKIAEDSSVYYWLAHIMAHPVIHAILAAITLAFFSGCDGLSLDTYWRSERYVLVAVDARGQMNLAFDGGDGTAVGLVGPTVFSIGAEDKYIVVKQHPSKDAFGAFDRTITHYFLVERTSSSSLADRQKGVRGPLSSEEFEKLSVSLSLPKFTKTFDDLK
jgi:hypothetical protein